MHIVANAIIVLWGWQRIAVAVAAGAISALALPPWSAFPILWLTIPIFVWLIDGAVAPDDAGFFRRMWPAALVGWSFGFGYFLAGLWWIGAAFLVEADIFGWLMPFAVVALPAGLAIFWAFGAVLARSFWPDGWPRILVFAVALSLAEWLRGHLFTGFPWNAFGYTLTPSPVMMQSASLIGLWGLTPIAFVVFAAPALLAESGRSGRTGRIAFLSFASVLFLAHVGFGLVRLSTAPERLLSDIHVRVVQPSIEQSEKWVEENADAIVGRYIELSDAGADWSGVGDVTLLIWPESAFPFLLTERADVLAAIAALLPEGTTLITGAARSARTSADGPAQIFNSVYVIDHDGEILSAYDKTHLVPFGEYLPFQSSLEAIGFKQLTRVHGGFAAGPGLRTLTLPAAPPFAPLICYEIIFPGAAVEPGSRPGWLLNLTNDAWFGDTPGPRQHFLQARLRAVEEGLPLVRAANSGISAIVDPHGRILAALGIDQVGVVDGALPANLPRTVYKRYGSWLFLLILIGFLGAATFSRLKSNSIHN